ncbi:MAG: PhzF family phenazine biosynthesis protein, partial [Planctomycetales bacterium]|nr:PhzF family phenazine biosynthesis protein [Planctomycetales bacterium]
MNSKPGIPIWQVDAFADRPFVGNPAAVCILESYPRDDWMQSVAEEMNLSETSFVVPADGDNTFHLRWFTPVTEVDLCGHATLATVHTLVENNHVDVRAPIRFHTRSGELCCRWDGTIVTLDFPSNAATNDVGEARSNALLTSLGIAEGVVMQTKYDLVVVVGDADVVQSMRPDFNALALIETRGVMVTAASRESEVDFISRFFAPRCGINEDPVT